MHMYQGFNGLCTRGVVDGYTCVEFNLSILKISDDDGPSMITNSIKLRFTITNEELVLLNLTP